MSILRRASASALLAVLLLLVLAPTAGAQEGSEPGDQIVLSGTVNVPRGREVGEVVVFHGDVSVAGVVLGDVVVLDGRVTVNGQVSGSVVNLGGPVALGRGAQVGGSVLASETLTAAEGAQVGGISREGVSVTLAGPLEALGRFVVWLAVAISTLVLGLLVLLFMPRGVDAIHAAATSAPWASGGWGVGAVLGLPMFGVLLLASVLGLPLGLALLLGLALVLFVGYAMSAWIVGRLIWSAPRNRPTAFLIGWVALTAVGAIPFVGGLTWLAGAIFGLGATTVATWRAGGRRSQRGRHRAGAPAVGFEGAPEREPAPAGAPSAGEPLITEEAMGEEGVGL
jgi:hypothetical protein